MVDIFVNIASPELEYDDVLVVLDNIEAFVDSYKHLKTNLYGERFGTRLTKWLAIDDENYLALLIMVNLNDARDYQLRVIAGYNDDDTKHVIHESDAFLDIRTDKEHVQTVLNLMEIGEIPLHNRDSDICSEKYPFVLDNDM